MKNLLVALGAGMLFALGLGLSGMTLPSKVIGFLDITGAWDPSLAFVMVGAIGVHALAWQLWLRKRGKPLLQPRFFLPELKRVDKPLLVGAVLFGIGWGIGGFCPGPALVSMVSRDQGVLVFVFSMLMGMFLFEGYAALRRRGGRRDAGTGILRQGDEHPILHRL